MKTAILKTTRQEVLENGDTLVLPCEVNYYYISNNEQVKEAIEELTPIMSDPKAMVAVDTETNGLDPFVNDIILLQIGTKHNIQYVFDYRKIDAGLLKPLLLMPCWKIGHNLKFDAKMIKVKLDISLSKLYDTFLAEKVIRGGQFHTGERYSLDVVLGYRLGKELRILNTGITSTQAIGDKKLESAKKRMQLTFQDIGNKDPDAAQLAYAVQDVAEGTLFKLVEVQMDLLLKEDVNTLYDPEARLISNPEIREAYEKLFKPKLRLWETAKLEFKFLEVVIDIELVGINFSKEKHQVVLDNIIKDYSGYRMEFLKLLGVHSPQRTLLGTASINPDSNKQVLQALNNLKLDLQDTSSENLEEKLRDLTPGTEKYRLLDILLNYRTMSTLVKSYGVTLSNQVHPNTGRIHYDITQILETGRISNSNPNLQKIPSKITNWKKTGNKEIDEEIKSRDGLRECFIARPGYTLVKYDYDSQELRVAASQSRDSNMVKAFKENKNLHCYSATLMYNEEYEDFYRRYKAGEDGAIAKRTAAKTVSFGSLYGSGPSNLAKVLRITLERAKDILERFWLAYPEMKKAMNRYAAIANKVGYSNTVLGRRRYYTDIVDRIKWTYCEKSPSVLEVRAKEIGLEWLFEKDGMVTYENIEKFREAIMKKYKNDIGRQAGNHHVQGTSADMTKLAAINIWKEFKKQQLDANIVCLIHDEILVECKEEVAEVCRSIVETKMKDAMGFFCPNIPAAVEGKVSSVWSK